MKTPTTRLSLAAALALACSAPAIAQYDDVYFDPSRVEATSSRSYAAVETPAADDTYDSEFYGEDIPAYDADRPGNERFGVDDYSGFEYSSRIRRFNRPYAGFGYYDPVYVDQAYYGYANPYRTTLIYSSPYGVNAYRAARLNRYRQFNDPFYSPYNDPFYNPWNDPFVGRGNAFGWGGNPYGAGFNSGFGGGFGVGNAYYCPPSWGTGAVYNVPGAVNTRPPAPATVGDRGNRGTGTRGSARPTSPNRGTPSATSRTARPSTPATNSRGTTTREPSSTIDSRSGSRPSTTNSRGSDSEARPSRPATPSRSTSPRQDDRPSYRTPSRSTSPRENSRPSYSAPSRSSSRPSYSAPSRSSSPAASPRSSGGSSRSSSSSRGGRPN